jgi:hypothetical protein
MRFTISQSELGEHVVAARVDEHRDLGHALVLALAVGRIRRILHVEPQRGARIDHLEVVLGRHEIFPETIDLEGNEAWRAGLTAAAASDRAPHELLAGHGP